MTLYFVSPGCASTRFCKSKASLCHLKQTGTLELITKVALTKLISHTKTKAELTAFLTQKEMERGEGTGKQVIMARATQCKATNKDVSHLQSDHEGVDTNIILHALEAPADSATELSIYFPDTDVLVLAIRYFPEMCVDQW